MSTPGVRLKQTLQSWKEISAFLGVTVRTVQNWEREKGLPVHRRGRSVYAFSDELEAWLERQDSGFRDESAQESHRRTRSRILVGSIALLILLAALAVGWWHFTAPGKPVRCDLDETIVRASDQEGRPCWTKQFPDLDTRWYRAWSNVAPSLVADFGSEPETLILLSFVSLPKSPAPRGRLVCFSEKGTERWEFSLGAPKSLRGRPLSSSYMAHIMRKVEIAGRDYILVIARHEDWFPCQVVLLDPKTGGPLGSYFHPGAFFVHESHDLDGDGVKEILLGGVNNPGAGLGHAALVVLKPPFTGPQHSNRETPSRLPGFGGGEVKYLLFPRTDLTDVAKSVPAIGELSVEENRRIRIKTAFCTDDCFVVYYLDFSFRVLDALPSDGLHREHERLRRSGVLDHDLSTAEIESWRKVLSFPSAPDGNSPEVERLFSQAR